MRKKKKSCSCNNQGCNLKKEETNECKCNYQVDKCECNVKSCIPDKTITPIESCKPTNCKTKIKEYICPFDEDCEIKCEDKCVDLAKKAEELFEKAMKYEKKAM